ncbi:MAG: class IV adenylate cyclase [Chloroflexi bacterium]|nr:class IV adenylate cyclase [Chloroflexota bacterium]MYD48746.1 class IV adenylate cyclase [Chloroflexota bacterium]
MDVRLNRELKAYCADFAPVRQIIRDLGAVFVEVKEQVDCYYHLPLGSSDEGNRRLKLRVEKGKGELIYYCERQESNARTSRFQLWETNDLGVGEVLERALGTRAVVRKRRELWEKDNAIFNLDAVEEIGQIFEVEVRQKDGYDIDSQVREYRCLFEPYLGGYILGSNEDLIVASGYKLPQPGERIANLSGGSDTR